MQPLYFLNVVNVYLALNDSQPPPIDLSTSRPINTCLQQHLKGEQQDYNMD